MKIIFYPTDYTTNKYGSIITEGLKSKGIQLVTYESAFKNYRLFKSIDLVHLNWFETLGNSTYTDIKRFLGRAAKLIAFKLAGKKIVWTMHNKMPHDRKNLFLKKALMNLVIRSADTIIVHSRISKQILTKEYHLEKTKIKYIPHPDYIGSYKSASEDIEPLKDESKLNLLFLGAVKPYKNIELLIDVVRPFPEVILTIAGNTSTSYKNFIIEYAKTYTNINLVLEFIPDDMLTHYIKNSDLLILPYDIKSSLNSGTVILAFSNAKTVICPQIGTISDLSDESMALSYTYSNDEEHAKILTSRVEDAIRMKKLNTNIFQNLGNKVYQEVSIKNNKNMMIDKFLEVYKSIIN